MGDIINKEKELAKNTAMIGIGKICTQFVSFLLLPLYTNALSTTEYGIVDVLNTYVSLLMPVFTLQLEQGSFRYLLDVRQDKEKTKTIISTVLMFISLISIIYSVVIMTIGKIFEIQYSIFLLLNLVSMGYSNILLQIVRGLGNNLAYSIGSFVTAVTTILLNIGFILFFHWGAGGMLLSTAMANFVCCIYLFFKKNCIDFFLFTHLKEAF